MNATQWAAWVGACTGIAGLVWNIYTKITAGPKLRVTAFAGMVKRPSPPNNPKFLKITVQNIGTAPTTITNVTFHTYGSWWKRLRKRKPIFSAVLDNYEGPAYPRPLEVGREWVAVMAQDDRFTGLLNGATPLYLAIHYSFAKSPTQVKVSSLLGSC
jgi:hypothetical protein